MAFLPPHQNDSTFSAYHHRTINPSNEALFPSFKMKSSEADIRDATSLFLAGKFRSLRHCEDVTGVCRQIISARLVGRKPHKDAHQNSQKMSPEMELELTEWIILENRAGNAPGLVCLRCMAEEMLAAAGNVGNDVIIGEKWHLYFI